MAETTADVRRDIELTRERMTSTLAELERKLHLGQIVRENPWPAVGVAFGAGLLLSGSRADVKAAAATATATRGATSRLGPALDDIVANLMAGVGAALQGHVDTLLDEVKAAIGAPTSGGAGTARPLTGNGADQGMATGRPADALGQRDEAGAWSASADASSLGGLTPSSAGSQGMPRAD
ncbi:DUF3618 domain-containing protein [Roseisolibacter agri]|uniref:DUF3618 domain-containing protein n=1 Tax=Roseisolibacter agri TaxID=2014610 RepID=A0AA37Q4Y8_9BACT|nr:DUF3618 domain-containing protein [Roseisolibacter agri]GLC26674.1 hypothetical protein rosag_31870 [Roseisolibacter agri]